MSERIEVTIEKMAVLSVLVIASAATVDLFLLFLGFYRIADGFIANFAFCFFLVSFDTSCRF